MKTLQLVAVVLLLQLQHLLCRPTSGSDLGHNDDRNTEESLSLVKNLQESQEQTRQFIDYLQAQEDSQEDIDSHGDGDPSREGFSVQHGQVTTASNDTVFSKLINYYKNLNLTDVNHRFHIILDTIVPDLSLIQHICPGDCSNCEEGHLEILCRTCCSHHYKEPMSIGTLVHEHYDFILSWILSSKAFQGLKAIFNTWLGLEGRYGKEVVYDPNALVSLIKNFQFQQGSTHDENSNLGDVQKYLNKGNASSQFPEDLVCGYYFQDGATRIGSVMGGSQVDNVGSFPWQMSLSTGWMGLYYQHRCGAALVNTRWAVTAAHCTIDNDDTDPGLFLLGGFLHIDNRHDAAQIRKVERIVNHENFVRVLYENDISLLKMSQPIVYTPKLLPICLPQESEKDKYDLHVGQLAKLTGWGRKWDNGPLADQLLNVTLPVITNNQCMSWYNASGSRQYIPESIFLCAGYKDGEHDACSGDSGGPLVVNREDGRAHLLGIVSWGIGCGTAGRPGVYTRISQYVDWIHNNIYALNDEPS